MENCLVTQLKGNVDNNNIPKFDTAFVDYFGGWTTGNLRFYIVTGTKPVTVKSKKQFYVGTTHTSAVTETIIQPNTASLMEYEASDIGTDPVSKIIEINGIYNLKKIGMSVVTNNFVKYFDFTPTNINGISNLLNYAPLDCFEGYIGIENFDLIEEQNLQYAVIFNDSGTKELNIDKFVKSDRLQMLEALTYTTATAGSIIVSDGSISNCTSLKVLNARYKGELKDLPVNLELLSAVGSYTTGSIEDYVNKCILSGRTSGRIILRLSLNNATYNNIPLTIENVSEKFQDNNSYWTVVSWTNGVLNPLSGTQPSDFSTYCPIRAIYTWVPYPTE